MGSEMCIRDRSPDMEFADLEQLGNPSLLTGCLKKVHHVIVQHGSCLLYTSDAADERSSVDLGGRRIIKKKNPEKDATCLPDNKRTLDDSTERPTR